jgi:4'-phosphopantetheinyl transferase EntD
MSIDLNESALQRHFGAVCSIPTLLVYRHQVEDGFELTAAESLLQTTMGSEQRQLEYRIGRSALKAALVAIGKNDDTSTIVWPSPYCSLTHSHGHAIAVSRVEGEGIGVDLQLLKMPAPATADRILSSETLRYWRDLPEDSLSRALQRFWTVNEAVYKACPAPQPAYFRHYRMHDPGAMDSKVSIDGTDLRFTVHTVELTDGFVSLAYRI